MMRQPKIIKVEPVEPYFLRLHYETDEIKTFDVSPYISGPWYGQLADMSYCKTVQLLPEGNVIKWPNGQDIAPHELYDASVPEY